MNTERITALVEGENAETIVAIARTFDKGQPIEALLKEMYRHVDATLKKWRECENYEKLKELVERYVDVRNDINLILMEL